MKLTALALVAASLSAQSFEVASIKRSAPETGTRARYSGAVPRQQEPGRINYPNVRLKAVVAQAWGVSEDLINGPQWLDDERWDIVATLPAGKSQTDVPVMLQHLLAERFHMTVHAETKPRAGLALLVGKGGPKLTPSTPNSRPGFVSKDREVTFMKVTLSGFARTLASFSGRPVTDETKIEGEYDIRVNASMEDIRAGAISTAIQDLGLRLETRTTPTKFIVVDKADKIPTAN